MSERNLSILMVLTSNTSMGSDEKPTGFWFEEVSTPYFEFSDSGASVTLASMKGGAAPADPRSLKPAGENADSVERFLADSAASAALGETIPIGEVDLSRFDAIFIPGGHGTMWDMPHDEVLGEMLQGAWEAGKVVAAVCHGPAGLVGARNAEGTPIVSGRRVTGFSDSEERAVGLAEVVPFLLETRLRELGGRYENGPDFKPFAVADGRLVTGQNPASSALTARLALEALRTQA